MPKYGRKSDKGDWRDIVVSEMYDVPTQYPMTTYETALRLITDAAFNRRMDLGEYIGRAALAFAVYDSGGEVTWEEVTEKEPPCRDIRMARQSPKNRKRMRGHGFGRWKIVGLSE